MKKMKNTRKNDNMDLVIFKIPLDLLDKIKSMSDKYDLNPITLLKAALDQYDRTWEDTFETKF